jgi:hypothetical protein
MLIYNIPDIIEITRPHLLTEEDLTSQHAIAEAIFEKGLEEINRGEMPKSRR